MSDSPAPAPKKVALLDTSVQVDRIKAGARCRHIDGMLGQFDFSVATSICLLEFKATVIGQCIYIYNQLRRLKRFTLVWDECTESQHRQAKLRGHILRNVIGVFGGGVGVSGTSSHLITEPEDAQLAEKAALMLALDIPVLYDWFGESVGGVLTNTIHCTRASERPVKRKVAFTVNLPECSRAVGNKHCRVEELIRERAPSVLQRLQAAAASMPENTAKQILRTCDLFQRVLADAEADLTHGDCRSAGDCLIALEAQGTATHALSTNVRDWEVMSKIAGFHFVRVEYPWKRK